MLKNNHPPKDFMSVRFSENDLQNYNARRFVELAKVEGGEAKESDLHDKIMAECKRRGWCVVHSRMDRATTTASGVADFIIFADKARLFVVEAKNCTGKLSPAQNAFRAHLAMLGHACVAVRSFREFANYVNEPTEIEKQTKGT